MRMKIVGIYEKLNKPGKPMFWGWIAYQTIKGTATTCVIWLPLLYAWAHSLNHP